MTRFAVGSSWKILLTDMGIVPDEVLRRAQLPSDLFVQTDASLSSREYFGLWRALEDLAGGSTLAVRILENLSVEMFAPPIFAALCSPNLEVAARRVSQFKPLIGPMRLDVETGAEAMTLSISFLEADVDVPDLLVALELGFFVQLARIATRTRMTARAATTLRDVPGQDAYAEFLGVMPARGDTLSVTFSLADARRPFVTENNAMWAVFDPDLRRRLACLSAQASMTERVRAALLELIPSGLSSADDVAAKLIVTRRTLQRRLEEEHTSFKTVLAEVREALARHYINQTKLPYSQISFLLGYQDPNSFFRAFHAWTGMTPDVARVQGLH
ncbi:AraC family transcriptional regulator [Burkholderia lata]|uniref:AraC family transcriptional regulator n=1 Tax=Burkholderia lata (strain ATCC 17760 / DSM 23089 / LMG 22485 / NCIMB 9086 / R18194 / 383) TaxID=482957 RepID=UPI001452E26C|nr:AraC family transcriptional regulator [Burkholderia lata]VWD59503.1 AraC family transcriptional regulator [Burkholderia lata]